MTNYINNRPLLLASGSPRRKQLLESAGFQFRVQSVEVDESFPEDMEPHLVAGYLAQKKAQANKGFLRENEILLSADSIVVVNNRIFNKPADHKEAYHMLAHLSGKMHTVYTGICMMDTVKTVQVTGVSEVFFRDFTHEEIEWYIERYKPFDKAGGYAIQEWIGLCKIARIEGTQANITGLPVDLVYESLKQFEGALGI